MLRYCWVAPFVNFPKKKPIIYLFLCLGMLLMPLEKSTLEVPENNFKHFLQQYFDSTRMPNHLWSSSCHNKVTIANTAVQSFINSGEKVNSHFKFLNICMAIFQGAKTTWILHALRASSSQILLALGKWWFALFWFICLAERCTCPG